MKNILLIDDDLNHLAVLAVALVESGYWVIPKMDAESATAIARENVSIDLIILNYDMPGLDVPSFMLMLGVSMPNVPVIVFTGCGNLDTYLKVMSLGAFEYMNEPVIAEELKRVVDTALHNRAAETAEDISALRSGIGKR